MSRENIPTPLGEMFLSEGEVQGSELGNADQETQREDAVE